MTFNWGYYSNAATARRAHCKGTCLIIGCLVGIFSTLFSITLTGEPFRNELATVLVKSLLQETVINDVEEMLRLLFLSLSMGKHSNVLFGVWHFVVTAKPFDGFACSAY